MFGIQDTLVLEFIILFSKTMPDVQRASAIAMEMKGSLSLLLIDDQSKRLKRDQDVDFGSMMYRMIYCDDKKIVHLDVQGMYALYLPSSLFSFGAFNYLRVKGSAVSHHFLQELI